MINGKKVLAYIPIRSGSKGIPDKNIIDVCGKPLVAYTIEAAKKSKYVDKIIVSTDSEKYALISKQYGADVPFIRPKKLAEDKAVEMDACLHLIDWIEKNIDDRYDIIIKLQATSPLRLVEDIDGAIEKLEKSGADTVVSLSEAQVPPVWMNTLPDDHSLVNFISDDVKRKNRQELPTFYQLNGMIFIARWNFIKCEKTWMGGKSIAYITSSDRSVDIDNQIDLELVKILMKKNSDKYLIEK